MPELKIIISAENQKAIDELKQLQDKLFQLQETVKNYKGDWPLTHTIETSIPKIQARITELQGTLTKASVAFDNFGNDTQKIAVGSNRAGLALNDLSRIAQDAPYGFIGISNNLNPMLESFQRLQKESGSTSAALKAMASSLMGPAGIGLAIGVVSSLLVVFGDKLFKSSDANKAAAEKTKEHTDALKAQKQAIEQIYSSVAKEETQVISLIAVLDNENETRNRKVKALDELKKINPQIFQGLKLENDVVVGLNNAYEKYLNSLNAIILLKIKQKELEEVTEKILKAQGVSLTQEDKDIQATGKSLKDSLDLKKTDNQLRKEATDGQIKNNKEQTDLNGLLEQQKKIIQQIRDVSSGIKIQGEGTTSNEKLSETEKIIKKLNEESQSLNYQLSTGLIKELPTNDKDKESYFSLKIKAISDAIKQLAGLTSGEAKSALSDLEKQLKFTETLESMRIVDKGAAGKSSALGEKELDPARTARAMVALNKEVSQQLYDINHKSEEATLRQISVQEQAYKQFANTIANEVTGAIMGMWDAMQHGESPIKALNDMLMKLLEQLVATAIKAEIVSLILSSLGGGAGAVAANGGQAATGFFDIFKKLIGLADGGIVSKPTLAMVGEGSQSEAIMPLSKLGNVMNNSFNAGAMSGSSSGGGGQFVLRGQDLLLAVNRTQKASSLKGQSISLA
jgi:hypothetical protein